MKPAEEDKTMNPLVFEVKGRNEHWNPFLDDSSLDDETRISYNPISREKVKPKLEEFTHCDENESRQSRSLYIAASDLFEKNKNLFTDKIVPPEVIVRYKEIDYHIVKDICVDEGMPLKGNFVIERSKHDQSGHSSDGVELELFESAASSLDDTEGVSVNDIGSKEEKDDKSESSFERENITFDFDSSTPVKNGTTGNVKEERSIDSENVLDHKDEHADHISDAQFKNKENGSSNINDNLNDENVQPGHKDENCDDISYIGHGRNSISSDGLAGEPCVCENGYRNSGDDPVVSQVKCEVGESSFSAASLITYTGPIAHSGSLSVRSDTSATSARSFAFPILQSEWNSSPVRMTNADGTHLRRHKGWRSGLCCRF